MWKYVVAWVPMVVIAIANGAIREAWYGKRMPELRAHQICTGSGLLLLGAYIWVIIARWPPESLQQSLGVGLAWLALTIGFEFLFGRYVAHHSWSRLFRDYNILAGRLWMLVLILVAIAPYVFVRLLRH
jgi:hypothetical protein